MCHGSRRSAPTVQPLHNQTSGQRMEKHFRQNMTYWSRLPFIHSQSLLLYFDQTGKMLLSWKNKSKPWHEDILWTNRCKKKKREKERKEKKQTSKRMIKPSEAWPWVRHLTEFCFLSYLGCVSLTLEVMWMLRFSRSSFDTNNNWTPPARPVATEVQHWAQRGADCWQTGKGSRN